MPDRIVWPIATNRNVYASAALTTSHLLWERSQTETLKRVPGANVDPTQIVWVGDDSNKTCLWLRSGQYGYQHTSAWILKTYPEVRIGSVAQCRLEFLNIWQDCLWSVSIKQSFESKLSFHIAQFTQLLLLMFVESLACGPVRSLGQWRENSFCP